MSYKKKEKISLMLYYDYIEQFECLTDAQLRQLIYAMIEFDKNGKEIKLDKITKMAFISIKKRLILDREKWKNTCETNSENAKKRWNKDNATVCDGMPKDAKHADIEKEIEKEIEIEKERESNNIAAPTLDSVISFGKDLGVSEDYCKNFFNNYESTGWKIGKNDIKNWKAKFEQWVEDDLRKGNIKIKQAEEYDTRTFFTDEDGRTFKYDSKGGKHYV